VGIIRDLQVEPKNRAKDIIEDFMIAANGVTARYLSSRNLPPIRRVVRTPKRWERIVEIAGDRGFRLPDLITQRLLKAAVKGRPLPYRRDELKALAKQCTEKEDAANKVERQVGKSAAALLLLSRIGERFDALVTGASSKGTWVRLLTVPVEGKLMQGFEGADVGDRMRV
jgi:exoribonuclease R